jgi:hypothetical protein
MPGQRLVSSWSMHGQLQVNSPLAAAASLLLHALQDEVHAWAVRVRQRLQETTQMQVTNYESATTIC